MLAARSRPQATNLASAGGTRENRNVVFCPWRFARVAREP